MTISFPRGGGGQTNKNPEILSASQRIAYIFGILLLYCSPSWVQNWAKTLAPSASAQKCSSSPDGKESCFGAANTTANVVQSPSVSRAFRGGVERACGHLLVAPKSLSPTTQSSSLYHGWQQPGHYVPLQETVRITDPKNT